MRYEYPKINTTVIGAEAEHKVSIYLVKKNYVVLDKNFRTKYGEIDLIVQKDNIIRFVEVKKREKIPETLSEIIPEKKKKSLIKTAKIFISKNKINNDKFIFEFDLIIINSKNNISHYSNFFEVNQ